MIAQNKQNYVSAKLPLGATKKSRGWIVLGGVLLAVLICYLPSLNNQFVNWDDNSHLLENQTILQLDPEHVQNMFQQKVNKTYIPLTTLSFALENKFFGQNPFFYHLDNLLLHLFITAFAFILARMIGVSIEGAGIAALLFGLHPLHVESVVWVTERKDVLYSFFYVAALFLYWRYIINQKIIFLGAVVILGTLSVLAKPMAISLPLIFLLSDWFLGRPLKKNVLIEKIPFLVVICAIGWLTYSEHVRIPGHKIFEAGLIWMWTFVFYIRQFVFPGILLPVYHLPRPITIFSLEYIVALVVFVLLLMTLWRFRQQRLIIFAFLFYLLSIFFLLRFDDQADVNIVADRFMYLPSLGFCLALGWGWQQMGQWLKNDRSLIMGRLLNFSLILILVIFAFRTIVQEQIWKNSFTLWRYQILFYPEETIAINNLANAYQELPYFEKVKKQYKILSNASHNGMILQNKKEIDRKVEFLIQLYQKAAFLNPEYVDAYYNWAKLNQDIGRWPEAINLYQKTLAIDPLYKDASFSLGCLYQEIGEREKAIMVFQDLLKRNQNNPDVYINIIKAYTKALKVQDDIHYKAERAKTLEAYRTLGGQDKYKESAVFYFNLGYLYSDMGDYENAKAAYEVALDINSGYLPVLYNLGNTYEQLGEVHQAIALYEQVIAADPKYADAYLNLGIVYGLLNNYPKAIELYQKAIKVNPDFANAYFNLGFIYEISADLPKAIENYEKATQIEPKHAEAYYNLGNVYASLGLNQKAIQAYKSTVEAKPDHMNAHVNLSILYFRTGDFDKAVFHCDLARSLGYDAPAEYLKELERYRKAG